MNTKHLFSTLSKHWMAVFVSVLLFMPIAAHGQYGHGPYGRQMTMPPMPIVDIAPVVACEYPKQTVKALVATGLVVSTATGVGGALASGTVATAAIVGGLVGGGVSGVAGVYTDELAAALEAVRART